MHPPRHVMVAGGRHRCRSRLRAPGALSPDPGAAGGPGGDPAPVGPPYRNLDPARPVGRSAFHRDRPVHGPRSRTVRRFQQFSSSGGPQRGKSREVDRRTHGSDQRRTVDPTPGSSYGPPVRPERRLARTTECSAVLNSCSAPSSSPSSRPRADLLISCGCTRMPVVRGPGLLGADRLENRPCATVPPVPGAVVARSVP